MNSSPPCHPYSISPSPLPSNNLQLTLSSKQFRHALKTQNGELLGSVFSPSNLDIPAFAYSTNHALVRKDVEYELGNISAIRNEKSKTAWVEAFCGLWKVAFTLERDEDDGAWQRAYEGQKETMLWVCPCPVMVWALGG